MPSWRLETAGNEGTNGRYAIDGGARLMEVKSDRLSGSVMKRAARRRRTSRGGFPFLGNVLMASAPFFNSYSVVSWFYSVTLVLL